MKFISHVACILNGTLESSVTALLLKRKGFQVTGIVVQNKLQQAEYNNAQEEHAFETCKLLDIPLKEISLSEDQWKPFFTGVLEDYKQGFNPDAEVLFMKHVLSGSAYQYARGQAGADAVALPLYARTDAGDKIDRFTDMKGMKLFKAVDQMADESPLLCQIPQKTLQRCIFPLGELSKDVVKLIGQTAHLDEIPERQPLPYVDKTVLLEIIEKDIPEKPGKLLSVEDGSTLGYHRAFHKYEAGANVEEGGRSFYVSEKSIATGDVYLVSREDHPALLTDTLFTSLATWTHRTPYHFYHHQQMMDCDFRARTQPPTRCSLTVSALNEWCGNKGLILSSSKPMRAVVPGNYCVFYQGEELIGCGQTVKAGPSHYAMNYKKYAKDNKRNSSEKGSTGIKGLFQRFIM